MCSRYSYNKDREAGEMAVVLVCKKCGKWEILPVR